MASLDHLKSAYVHGLLNESVTRKEIGKIVGGERYNVLKDQVNFSWNSIGCVIETEKGLQFVVRFPKGYDNLDRLERWMAGSKAEEKITQAIEDLRQEKLAENLVPISYLTYCVPTTRVEIPYTICPRFPGVFLTPELYQEFSPEQKKSLAQQLSLFLFEMHGLPANIMDRCLDVKKPFMKRVPKGKLRDRETMSLEPWQYGYNIQECFETLRPHLTEVEMQSVEAAGQKFDQARQRTYVVFRHMDLHAHNYLIDPKQKALTGIFDFGFSDIGDFHFDFARMYMVDVDHQLIEDTVASYNRLVAEHRPEQPRANIETVKVYAAAAKLYLEPYLFELDPKNMGHHAQKFMQDLTALGLHTPSTQDRSLGIETSR